jgi:hypothetical protein
MRARAALSRAVRHCVKPALSDEWQKMERTGRFTNSPDQGPSEAIRAAEYVRMSTEHQQYSTDNQQKIIAQYAERRGMIIVRTYTDAGKSGLRIDGRDALKQLIQDVEAGRLQRDCCLRC